ncbi:RNA polymerase sigma factor [Symmachiella dynata]|uniref:RNA polymerase sigma factor n=1 Tax=Symmachiella dynata TaxID=2527995 RepID=UPI0030EDA27F
MGQHDRLLRMKPDEFDARLSQIETDWKMILDASRGAEIGHKRAIQTFFDQYSRAVYRYLLGAVRDPDAADELFQEFALRISKGSFRNADQSRGRFRAYLKSALINLVIESRRKVSKKPGSIQIEPSEFKNPAAELEAEFTRTWRNELLSRTWQQLEEVDRRKGRSYYVVLKFQTEHPQLTSTAAAEQLNVRMQGKRPAFTAAGMRKTLQRARDKFAEMLLDEVSKSLQDPRLDELENELVELELDPYCRSALRRRRGE